MKILICGFMGSGKSTFLKKLELNDLGFECIDLDHAIAVDLAIRPERLGAWILENGFPLFRDKEKTKIKSLLNHSNSMVIALGGGALTPAVKDLIKAHSDCKLVFLDMDFETCYERMKDDPNRPLSMMATSELKKLFLTRRMDYLQADLVLDSEGIKEIDGLGTLVHNLA